MKFFSTLLFLLILSINSFSQTFIKRYPYIQFIDDIIELNNGDIAFVGRYRGEYGVKSVFFKITSTGDSIFATDIPMNELSHLIQTSDGGFAIGGSSIQSSPLLVRLDNQGNELWSKDYGGYSAINALVEKPDGGFILLESGFKLRNTDASGNENWYKDLSMGSYVMWDLKKLSNGNYISAGYDYNSYITYYAKIDTSGNILLDKSDSLMAGYTYCVNPTSDNGFVISGTYSTNAGMIKCDSNGKVEFNKKLLENSSEFRFGAQTSDNGFIFSGLDILPTGTYMCVIKTDDKGDTLWTKKIICENVSTDCEVFKVLETKDGNYMIGGYNGNISYLSKFGESSVTSIIESHITGLSVYPNPFSDQISIEYTALSQEHIDIEVFNTKGQSVKSLFNGNIKAGEKKEFVLNGYGLAKGMYFVKVSSPDKIYYHKVILV